MLKITQAALLAGSLLLTAACQEPDTMTSPSQTDTVKQVFTVPPAGTVVDSLVQEIADDALNKRVFKVRILATSASATGLFNLELTYGHNFNSTEIVLPAWTDDVILMPQIRADSVPYQCLIGFDAGDGIFRELYKVSSDNGTLRLKQTMSYTIEK